jgi:death-on-curing protein
VRLRYENVTWVPVGEVEAVHTEQMGGAEPHLAAIRDGNLLISAVAMPTTTFGGAPLYGSLAEMAATYAWGIARNHPFVDGNKRTALLAALLFLRLNGFSLRVGPEWVDIMVSVADSTTGYSRIDLVGAFRELMGVDVIVVP